MGCFNVACSVSSISIGYGDDAVFLPLLPNNYNYRNFSPDKEGHQVGTQSMLIYSDCYFHPVCLPIKGKYNDYGSLECIEENENVKAIETFFNCKIEDFMNTVTRGGWEKYTEGEAYGLPKIKDLRKLDHIQNKTMLAVGFEKVGDFYEFPNKKVKCKVRITKTAREHEGKTHFYPAWELWEDDKIVSQETHSGYMYKLLERIASKYEYYIGIPDDYQEKARMLSNMSGMFIHRDVYSALAKKSSKLYGQPDGQTLEELGFVKEIRQKWGKDANAYAHPQVEDKDAYIIPGDPGWYITVHDTENPSGRYDITSVEDIALHYAEKHGVILDAQRFEKQYTYEHLFKKLIKEQKDYLKLNKEGREKLHKILEEKDYDLFNRMSRGPLARSSYEQNKYFGKMPYVEGIYSEFLNMKLLPDYSDWRTAQNAMYSANVFFFPAMNGEQHGNDEQSKVVLEAALEVVNRSLEEREED